MIQHSRLRGALSAAAVVGPLTWAGAAFAGCEPDRVAEKYPKWAGLTVRVATSPLQRPFAYSDPKDPARLIGSEIELNDQVFACAGIKYEYFISDNWSGLLAAVTTGQANSMLAAVNYNQDRGRRVDYVTYMLAAQSLVVPKGNPKGIRTMDDLCGHTGALRAGSTSATFLEPYRAKCAETGRPILTLVPAPNTEAEYRALDNGRIDFFLDDAVSAAARRAVDSDPKIDLELTLTDETTLGVVVNKGDDTLARVYLDGLKQMEESGEIERIFTKYGIDARLMAPVTLRNR